MYKKTEEEGRTTYIKVLSLIERNGGYQSQTVEFEIPLHTRFLHKTEFLVVNGFKNPFDYGFDNDLFIWTDTEDIKDLEGYEEIDEREFRSQYEVFCKYMSTFISKTYSLEDTFGKKYVERAKEYAQEKKDS